MKNPNAPANRLKRSLIERWKGEDYPGSEKRFQALLFAKDLAIFVLLPIFAIVIFKSCELAVSKPKKIRDNSVENGKQSNFEGLKSQILDFRPKSYTDGSFKGYAKRAPGTLIKVRLLNNLETYSSAPTHAQIIDSSLGQNLIGGTLIGEAVSDASVERINITFKLLKDPNKANIAIPISARALSLDGTFGVLAKKKGGIFARSALAAAPHLGQELNQDLQNSETKNILLKALSSGFMDESNSGLQVEQNRLQVLKIDSGTEFFVELTDYFPGSAR